MSRVFTMIQGPYIARLLINFSPIKFWAKELKKDLYRKVRRIFVLF